MNSELRLLWEPLKAHPDAVACRHNGYTAHVIPEGDGAMVTIEPEGPVERADSVSLGQQLAEEFLFRTGAPTVRRRVPICLVRPAYRNGQELNVDAVLKVLLAGQRVPGCELVPTPPSL